MDGKLIMGAGNELRTVSDDAFRSSLGKLPERMAARLAFMTPDHHAVRDLAVRELPRERRPLPPARIAQITGLDAGKVAAIVADLEKHLFFLVRDAAGSVEWAFPVTARRTRHRLTFSSGERISGA